MTSIVKLIEIIYVFPIWIILYTIFFLNCAGKSIFPVSEPDPDLQSRRESTIPDDDDDTGADDLSLSDNGIKGTCILIGDYIWLIWLNY